MSGYTGDTLNSAIDQINVLNSRLAEVLTRLKTNAKSFETNYKNRLEIYSTRDTVLTETQTGDLSTIRENIARCDTDKETFEEERLVLIDSIEKAYKCLDDEYFVRYLTTNVCSEPGCKNKRLIQKKCNKHRTKPAVHRDVSLSKRTKKE